MSEILLTGNVVIDGSGAPGLIISGGGTNRAFEVAAGVTVTLENITIENGSDESGGAILNSGSLTLDATTLASNIASQNGGAVENDGTLTVVDSTITGNTARLSGGGIDNTSNLTVQSSTIAGNSANEGGGIAATDGSTSLVDTIIATNTAANGGADVNGAVNSLGNNLIGDPAGATGLTGHDLVGLNPDLGPLQNNGGPTPTLALLAGSPAIDAGTNTSTLANDQRGLPRVIDGASDIGAFELQNVAPTADAGNAYTIHVGDSLTLNALDSTDANGDTLTYSWDINGDGTFGDAVGATPTLSWAQLEALGIVARSTPYLVRVMVSDGYGRSHEIISAPVTLTVLSNVEATVTNTPVAVAQSGAVQRARVDRAGTEQAGQ